MEKSQIPLIDQYNRRLNYLRISITDRCNLQCIYCMPHGGLPKLRHEDILTYEEILRLVRIATKLGVRKVRLTGGDPFLRKDVFDFIPRLTSLPGLEDVSLTTNGIYLKENLEKLKSFGIKRLNVSLDTLQREKYQRITGYDGLEVVWEAIELARKLGFDPVKINVVAIKGLNDDELLDFARLSLQYPFHVRFIEYMAIGVTAPDVPLQHIPSSLIREQLEELGELVPVPKSAYGGPAERFRFKGAPGEIGIISPVTNHFCHVCNRLRLTASGNLRPCLLSDREEDLRGPLRDGASDSELSAIFLKAASKKPHEHHSDSEHSIPFSGQMSSIGG
jgi:cyclic pyranopterin phosphate synthase